MVTDYYLPTLGGVQTLVKAHKEALERAGHTVVVACPLAEPSADPSVVALPISPVFKPDGYPFTWPYARTEQVLREALIDADIVHVHSEMIGAIAGLRVARELGIPIVQTMHGRIDVYTASVLPLPSVTTIPLAWLHRRRIPHVAPIAGGERFTSTRLARRMWRLMVNQANYADHVIVPSAHFAAKLRGQGVTSPLTVLSNGLEDSVLDQLTGARPRVPDGGLRVMWCGRPRSRRRSATGLMKSGCGISLPGWASRRSRPWPSLAIMPCVAGSWISGRLAKAVRCGWISSAISWTGSDVSTPPASAPRKS